MCVCVLHYVSLYGTLDKIYTNVCTTWSTCDSYVWTHHFKLFNKCVHFMSCGIRKHDLWHNSCLINEIILMKLCSLSSKWPKAHPKETQTNPQNMSLRFRSFGPVRGPGGFETHAGAMQHEVTPQPAHRKGSLETYRRRKAIHF